MDVRVLKSLATCALYPYREGRDSGSDTHSGLNNPNGAEFPDEVAHTVLNLGVPGGGMKDRRVAMVFSAGFDFALDVAAAITEDAAHLPNLSNAIAKAKAHIAEASREAA